ncbi:hypothetical protein DFH07DRAFT_946463 [Mycena maculata]|uniref:Uncharacterized protein n=1 Tax=Mycena maculata TaxID=230809 RepID=A0AAD7MMG6_9AGAR|nr:hypothetical protein DFH07DRAFT_946463 [Mycena maculata]
MCCCHQSVAMVIAVLFLPPSRCPRCPSKSPNPDRRLQHGWMGVIVDELEGCNAVWGLTGYANTPAANHPVCKTRRPTPHAQPRGAKPRRPCLHTQPPVPNPAVQNLGARLRAPMSVHPTPRCKTWVPIPARSTPHAGTAVGLSAAEMFIKRCARSWAATGAAGAARLRHSHTPEILHVQDLQRAHLVFPTPTPTTARPGTTCTPLPSARPCPHAQALRTTPCAANPVRPSRRAKARMANPARQSLRDQPRTANPARQSPLGHPRTPKPTWPTPHAKACGTNPARPTPHAKARTVIPARQPPWGQPRTANPTRQTPRGHPRTPKPARPAPHAQPRATIPTRPTPHAHPRVPDSLCRIHLSERWTG